MSKKYESDIVEMIRRKGSLHVEDIYKALIKKNKIAKKNQKREKTNIYVNNLQKLVKKKLISKTGKNIYGISIQASSSGFVRQYAENINIEKLNTLKTFAKKFQIKTGFYFLYKSNELYYVGIGNVFKRLTDHTKDNHKDKWNKFSFYITEKIEHAKEIETIIQRNLKLAGNTKIGRLKAKSLSQNINALDTMLKDF